MQYRLWLWVDGCCCCCCWLAIWRIVDANCGQRAELPSASYMRQDDLFKVMAVLLACDDPRNFLASNGASKRELLFNYYPLTSLRSRSYASPLSFVNGRLVVLASLFASLCGRFKLQCMNSWAAPADFHGSTFQLQT